MRFLWNPRVLVVSGVVLMLGLFSSTSVELAAAERDTEMTFTKDIVPILQRSCEKCHRPRGAAPMSLITYEDVRPWARSIKNRTGSREMPPWFIDKNIGIQQYKDDPSLTDTEIAEGYACFGTEDYRTGFEAFLEKRKPEWKNR